METAAHPILIRASNPFQNRRLPHLNLNRLTASIHSRFKLSRLIFNSQPQMSNLSADNLTTKQIEQKEGEKRPPPEKPEPGDCCGSGCVRCVWDVYYEELEDYNNRYKSDSKLS